jgi:hypothetical protein
VLLQSLGDEPMHSGRQLRQNGPRGRLGVEGTKHTCSGSCERRRTKLPQPLQMIGDFGIAAAYDRLEIVPSEQGVTIASL